MCAERLPGEQKEFFRRPRHLFEKMAAAGPIPDELSIDSSHVKAHRSASGSKRGSLKKRSAARGAEGRAKFMLWPTIAADRSLSR
jgi:hypothetical protein